MSCIRNHFFFDVDLLTKSCLAEAAAAFILNSREHYLRATFVTEPAVEGPPEFPFFWAPGVSESAEFCAAAALFLISEGVGLVGSCSISSSGASICSSASTSADCSFFARRYYFSSVFFLRTKERITPTFLS